VASIASPMVDTSTEKWLSKIASKLKYSRWYCGHFHRDEEAGDLRFVYEEFLACGYERDLKDAENAETSAREQ